MDEFSDPTPIATVDEYVTALKALRDQFAKDHPFSESTELRLLRTHYRAPQHTITTTQLADQVGFSSFSVANLQYGKLAHRIADELDYRPGPFASGTPDAPHWWRTLAYGNDGVALTDDGRYEWVMRPEVCRALEVMGWVGRRRP